jgi:hypothetical protein
MMPNTRCFGANPVTAWALLAALSYACSGGLNRETTADQEAPVPILEINDMRLMVEVILWRDFQPGGPSDGSPLRAAFRLVEADSKRVPARVAIGLVEIIYDSERWEVEPEEEGPRTLPSRVEFLAEGGPAWRTGAEVDVTVQVRDAEGSLHSVNLPRVRIRRVE